MLLVRERAQVHGIVLLTECLGSILISAMAFATRALHAGVQWHGGPVKAMFSILSPAAGIKAGK